MVEDENIETSSDENGLYGLGSTALPWGDTNGAIVPICPADFTTDIELRAKVLEILRETWGSYAKINFYQPTPGQCALLAFDRKVDLYFSGTPDFRGASATTLFGAYVELISDRALTENYERFRYQVIHEFGHALGFAHEQRRPDNWEGGSADQCPAPNADEAAQHAELAGGIYLTDEYDVHSIMNYCNPAGFPQDLSLGDIRGVRRAYGQRDVKGVIYALDYANQLRWYRHDGRTIGNSAFSSSGVIGGWSVKHLIAGGDSLGVIYTIDNANRLHWMRHGGRVDGKRRWAYGDQNVVGDGWDFTKVFGAGDGVLYGVTPYVPAHYSDTYDGGGFVPASGGELKWYKHDGREDGSYNWADGSGNVVGDGWQDFERVFAGDDGVIYAITKYVPAHYSDSWNGRGFVPASGGELKWYRHIGQADGSYVWAAGSGSVVGYGWSNFKHVFSGGDGVIYAVDSGNRLLWYRHDGRVNGSYAWAPGSGNVVGTGWMFQQLVGDD